MTKGRDIEWGRMLKGIKRDANGEGYMADKNGQGDRVDLIG